MPTSPSSPNPCARCHLKTVCPEPSTNWGLCKRCTETPLSWAKEREEEKRWTQRKGLVTRCRLSPFTPVLGCELGHRDFTHISVSFTCRWSVATQKRKSRNETLLENYRTELISSLLEAPASQPKGRNVLSLSPSLTTSVHQSVQNTAMKLQALGSSIWDRTQSQFLPRQYRFSALPPLLVKREYQ